jgi:hypothetical protein
MARVFTELRNGSLQKKITARLENTLEPEYSRVGIRK